jgi:hypothetical protein
MVTAILNNPGAVAGQEVYQGSGAVFFRANKAATFAVAKGDILVKDTGTAPDSLKLATAGAAIPGPFYICTQAAASADTKVSVATGGMWYVTGGDTIEFGDDVMLSTTVAGQTVKSTAITTIALQLAKVGVSEGFADAFGTGLQVASVVGDLYVLNLNAGNRG